MAQQTWECVRTINNNESVEQFVLSPSGQMIAVCKLRDAAPKTIKLWRTYDGKLIRCLETEYLESDILSILFRINGNVIQDTAFSADEKYLVCATCTQIITWHIETGRKVRDVKHRAEYPLRVGCFDDGVNFNVVGFSHDGEILAITTKDFSVKLIDSRTGEVLFILPSSVSPRGGLGTFTFSADRRKVAGLRGDEITICDVVTGNVIRTIAFSSDNQFSARSNKLGLTH
jgi:WD40 repeat protein